MSGRTTFVTNSRPSCRRKSSTKSTRRLPPIGLLPAGKRVLRIAESHAASDERFSVRMDSSHAVLGWATSLDEYARPAHLAAPDQRVPS
jgi:hypothetical protein